MTLTRKRIREEPSEDDGYRVLVDRLWPRGVSKERARIDAWMKHVAPSTELRVEFRHDPDRWGEFRERYLAELAEHREELRELARRAESERVTLLFDARDVERNNAVVLEQYLAMLGAPREPGA